MMFIRRASSAEPMRSRRGRGGTIADERRAFRYRQRDRAISRGLADYRLGVFALGSAAQQVAAPTSRYRALMEIEPIEVEGFYQKPRCFPFPSHGVQDATPPGREWFLELIVEHLPSHRGPAMIGDTERLIPNLYREAAEEHRQWAGRARLVLGG